VRAPWPLLLLLASPARAFSPPAPGAASPETLKTPDGPNSVRGLVEVPEVDGFSGQAQERVPIDLPRGRAGFGPSLDLIYDGGLGNGPLGVAWKLDVAVLQRSTRLGVPKYRDEDLLELSGGEAAGRLLPVGAGEWRIEQQGNRYRVVREGEGFRVDSPTGLQHYFGLSPSERLSNGSRVAEWRLSKTRDRANQEIVYAYTQLDGVPYLTGIAWGPEGTFTAVLDYPQRADSVVSFRAGFRVELKRRLQSITVRVGGAVRSTTSLAYDDGFPVSRVASVTVTGRGGQGRWPAISFTYVQPVQGVPRPVPMRSLDGWTLNRNGVSLLDVDGDGWTDLYRAESTGHRYRRNRGDGSFADAAEVPGAGGSSMSGTRLVDLVGAHRPMLVSQVDATWRVRALDTRGDGTAAAWQPPVVWRGTSNVPVLADDIAFCDLDGDARVDLLRTAADGLNVWFAQADGLAAPVRMPRISAANPQVKPGNGGTRAVEVNGDGLTDFVWLANDAFEVYLGRGDGTFEPSPRIRYPWPGSATRPAEVWLADFNRDGLIDLAHASAGHIDYYRGKPGLRFDAPLTVERPENADADVVVGVGDLNGNGTTDLAWSSPRGLWMVDLAGSAAVGSLATLDNGLGATVSLAYRSSAQLRAEDRAQALPWARLLPVSLPVLTELAVSPGGGDPVRRTRYRVRDGFWDREEHRFGGFLTSTAVVSPDAPTALRTTTSYLEGTGDDRVLRGQVASTRRESADGSVLYDETVNQYRALAVAGGAPDARGRRPFLESRTIRTYEGTSQPLTTVTTFVPDDQGRTAEKHEAGRTDAQGDERITQTRFADGSVPWLKDIVVEERVEQAGKQVARTRHFFGDHTKVEAFGKLGRGWPRRSDGWLQEGPQGRWVTLSSRTPDSFGNVVASYEKGVARTLGYDPASLHATSETLAPDSSHTLTWRGEWDEVLGVLVRVTDPNGRETRVTYDDLGRTRTLAADGHGPHIEHEYQWDSAPVRTVEYTFWGPLEEVAPRPAAWTDGARWAITANYVNGLGEPRMTTKQLAASRWIVSGWSERNDRGLVARSYEPFYWDRQPLPKAPPNEVSSRVAEFDAMGRAAKVRFPNGAVRTTARRPFEETVAVTGLVPTTSRLDGLGRISSTFRKIGEAVEIADATYDAFDRPIRIDLDHGRAWQSWGYDSLGRLRAAADSDGGQRSLAYYDQGWIKSHRNGVGQAVGFTYDALGRLKTLTSDADAYNYHYDAPRAHANGTNCAGRPCWIDEPGGKVDLGYDRAGNLVDFRRSRGGASCVERKGFGASGLLLSASWDDVAPLAYAYDGAERLLRIGRLLTVQDRDASGRILNETAGNGVKTSTEYDAGGLAQRVRLVGPANGVLLDLTATRYPFGAIREIADNDSAGLAHRAQVGVDAAGRVTSFAAGPSLHEYSFGFAYDSLQNMTLRSATSAVPILAGSYRYGEEGAGPRQLSSVTAGSRVSRFHYDGAGRTTAAAGLQLGYDGLDHLRSVKGGQHAIAYTYGYDGRRLVTSHDSSVAEIAWTEDVVERDSRRFFYVRDGSRVVGRIAPTGDVLYFHEELSAGPTLFTGAGGAVVEERLFEPFGAPLASSRGAVDWGVEPLNGLNKEVDPLTGFSDHGARWMMPLVGRWLTPDPGLRAPDGGLMRSPWDLHPYQYARQNPTHLWDPDGASAWATATSAGNGLVAALNPIPFFGPRLDPVGGEVTAYRVGYAVGMAVGLAVDVVLMGGGGGGFAFGAVTTVSSGGTAAAPGVALALASINVANAAALDAIARLGRAGTFLNEMRESPAPARVHGNSASAPGPQLVYRLFARDAQGQRFIWKTGITGLDISKVVPPRVATQIARLARDNPSLTFGEWERLHTLEGRAAALEAERQGVKQAIGEIGTTKQLVMPGQMRPVP
jgi:RHS repeat-associated protein